MKPDKLILTLMEAYNKSTAKLLFKKVRQLSYKL